MLALVLAVLSANTALGATTISIRVAASSDDAEEEGPDGVNLGPGGMYLTSSDLEIVRDDQSPSRGAQQIGMRFTSITVPKQSTITDAYITFHAIAPDSPNTNTGTTNLTIRGQAADNPTAFGTTNSDISNRPTTTSSVSWSPGSWTSNSDVNTPSIADVVQEIVSRSGWASGNSLVIIITGSGSRSADAYDGSSTTAPQLTVTYRPRHVMIVD